MFHAPPANQRVSPPQAAVVPVRVSRPFLEHIGLRQPQRFTHSTRRPLPNVQHERWRGLSRSAAAAAAAQTGNESAAVDLVLSSGFLAFAGHAGFLAAVEETGLPVGAVMGTSSGALAGALYSAGYTPLEVARELSRVPPIRLLRPSCRPWKGLLSLQGVVARLAQVLPATFEELQRPFAVGVVDARGAHRVVARGPLPAAVAASAAIPLIFAPVHISGVGAGFIDGGMADRAGLEPWRAHRRTLQPQQLPPPPAVVHLIARSSAYSGRDNVSGSGEEGVTVVNCPRSHASFLDLGAFQDQFDAARRNGLAALDGLPMAGPSGESQLFAAAAAAVRDGVHPIN